jgi:methyl-accepting chemotaxis protein PixJ
MKTTRSPKTSHQAALSASGSWWSQRKLRTKATLLAIALGTLPVAVTGTLSYLTTAPALKQEAIAKQEAKLDKAASLVSSFMSERYSNIQILSNLPIFTNPKGTANISKTQKQKILDKYVKIYGVYSNIAELSIPKKLL